MAGNQSSLGTPLAEQAVKTGILALKCSILLLWAQSMATPLQFLIGGAAVLLVVFLAPPLFSHVSAKAETAVVGQKGRRLKQVRWAGCLED